MPGPTDTRVLVLGLGNPILTDDGVGIAVATGLRCALPPEAAVDIEELSVGGLTLMERMVGYRHVVLVDAIMTGKVPAGTVSRLDLADLQGMSHTQHTFSPHDANLASALAFGRRIGLGLPDEIVVIAVEVENVLDFGESPTPPVAAAVPRAVEAVERELVRWGALPGLSPGRRADRPDDKGGA